MMKNDGVEIRVSESQCYPGPNVHFPPHPKRGRHEGFSSSSTWGKEVENRIMCKGCV